MKWIKIFTVCVSLITLLWGCDLTPQLLQTTPIPTIVPCFDCVRMETTINKHNFILNEPITMTVTLIKVTEKPHVSHLHEVTPLQTYIIKIFDQTGAEVPLTQTAIDTLTPSGSRILLNLTPGYPFSETFNIANWYQGSQSGVYTVTVEDVVIGEGRNLIPLTSPPLTFTLTVD